MPINTYRGCRLFPVHQAGSPVEGRVQRLHVGQGIRKLTPLESIESRLPEARGPLKSIEPKLPEASGRSNRSSRGFRKPGAR